MFLRWRAPSRTERYIHGGSVSFRVPGRGVPGPGSAVAGMAGVPRGIGRVYRGCIRVCTRIYSRIYAFLPFLHRFAPFLRSVLAPFCTVSANAKLIIIYFQGPRHTGGDVELVEL